MVSDDGATSLEDWEHWSRVSHFHCITVILMLPVNGANELDEWLKHYPGSSLLIVMSIMCSFKDHSWTAANGRLTRKAISGLGGGCPGGLLQWSLPTTAHPSRL